MLKDSKKATNSKSGPRDERLPGPYKLLAIYSSIIFTLPACLVGGYWVGHSLDLYFETSPWLTLVGLMLGAIGAFVQIFKLLNLRK